MTVEGIRAVGSLWPLALILSAFVAMFLFRSQIRTLLDRLIKLSVKHGDTELLVESRQAAVETPPAAPTPASVEPPAQEPEKPKELTPSGADKTSSNWISAVIEHRFNDADSAFEIAQKQEVDAKKKLMNEVIYHAFRYAEGGSSSLARVEEISKTNESLRAFALGWIGWAYRNLGGFEQAREAFKAAIDATKKDSERAKHTVSLAELLQDSGDINQAAALLLEAFKWAESNEARQPLFKALAAVFEDQNDKLMRAIVLEKALELRPAENDLRFSAAYAASEAGLSHLATLNYNTLIEQDSEVYAAFNNLGVQADGFKLPIKSVRLYRKAEEKGNTLATANLAYKLLNQGFVDEARERLEGVKSQQDVHPNVNDAIAEASRRQETEDAAWKEIIRHGARHKVFLHAFADSRFSPHAGTAPFDGRWKMADGNTFQIGEKDGQITAVWGSGQAKRKLEGLRVNRSVFGTLKKWNSGLRALSRLGSSEGYFDYSGNKALAYVSSDGNSVEVLALEEEPPEHFQFSRVESSEAADTAVTM